MLTKYRQVDTELKDDEEVLSGFLSRYGVLCVFKNKRQTVKALKEHRNMLMEQLVDVECAILEFSTEEVSI